MVRVCLSTKEIELYVTPLERSASVIIRTSGKNATVKQGLSVILVPVKSKGTGKFELNQYQREAVELGTGPALVVAGAGTGKTRVIVERIAKLIEDGVDPQSIAALTFTEKAAQEMLDRVNELRGGYTFDMSIMTYNAFGEQLLRQFATDIGMHSGLTLLGDVAKLVFMRDNLEALQLNYYAPLTQPDRLLDDIAGYFSRLKQQVVTVESYEEFISGLPANNEEERLEKARHEELKNAFGAYQKLCRKHNVIDYDDQIYLLLELFTTRPNVLARVRNRYRYLLVDEFQDTNPMQSRLLDLLCADEENIMVVGDDDQSIYGFRGATVENILSFKDRYPKAEEIVLTQNYRSTQTILDCAYRLIKHNNPHRLEAQHGFDKRLKAVKDDGPVPTIKQFGQRSEEYRWLCEDIERRLKAGQHPGSIAILARRNSVIEDMHRQLDAAGIQHQVAGQTHDLYREPVVKALIEALKAVVDPLDSKNLFHALSSVIFPDVDIQELSTLAGQARRNHNPLLGVVESSGSSPLIQALEQLESWRKQSAQCSVGQLTYIIIDSSGLKNRLLSQAEEDAASHQTFLYVAQFFEALTQFERIAQRTSVSAFLDSLPLISSTGDNAADDLTSQLSSDTASLMTIHKAKGLQWRTVYIPDLVEGSFPMRTFGRSMDLPAELTAHKSDADEPIREERRLMYVAMTRAEQELILTYATGSDGARRRKPSRFIDELTDGQSEAEISQPDSTVDLVSTHRESNVKLKTLPKHILSGENSDLTLTVSQLNDYLRCPYDFYYKHVLQVPVETNPTMQYGSTVHNAIESWQRSRLNGEPMTFQQVRKQLTKQWPKTGFGSAKQRQSALESAIATLKHYMERESKEDPPDRIEEPFTVNLPTYHLKIRGRFDAVYEGDAVEIRDFKTGDSVQDEAKAKRNAQSSNQLTLYALAWQQMHGELPTRLSLDFIDTGFVGSVSKQQKSIDTMQRKLGEAAQAIRNFEFPLGRDHRFCQHDEVA